MIHIVNGIKCFNLFIITNKKKKENYNIIKSFKPNDQLITDIKSIILLLLLLYLTPKRNIYIYIQESDNPFPRLRWNLFPL